MFFVPITQELYKSTHTLKFKIDKMIHNIIDYSIIVHKNMFETGF